MGTKIFIDSWTSDEAQVLIHRASASTIYKLLVAVRKEVKWPLHKENIKKLHNSGCLKHIVEALRSYNFHVVNVALCILENCCMDSNSTNKIIVNYNGLCELMQVLKRYPRNKSVNRKVMRIIGNMIQHLIADAILDREQQFFIYVVQFLQKYADENDKSFIFTMGMRALRMILSGRRFNEMVENCGLSKALGTLLITCNTKWNSKKRDRCILENIIKHLLPYCRYNYYPGIIEMRNTAKVDSSLYVSQLLSLAPKNVVEIPMNFMRLTQMKLDLPVPEICGLFITSLKENRKGFEEEYKLYYIRCLCYLLEHPSNRSSDRCMETVPQLIKELNDFQNISESTLESSILILGTLYKCCYHKLPVKEQLECNIVDVLIKKIDWIIGSSRTLMCKHKMQINRSYPDIVSYSWSSMGVQCQDLRDHRLLSLAPSSCLLEIQQENVTMSPYPGISDFEDYSLVCSKFEEPIVSKSLYENRETTNMEIARLLDVEYENSEGPLKHILTFKILLLLKTYSEIQPTLSELCSEPLLLNLIKCSNYFSHNNIITNITNELICKILD